ncbi:MAG: hypothetical protein ABMB14_32665 [Myxococcota bacterium]
MHDRRVDAVWVAVIGWAGGCALFRTTVVPVERPDGVDLAVYGRTSGGSTGWALGAGDLTGDGDPDLIVGAPYEGDDGTVSVWSGGWTGVVDHPRDAPIHLVARGEAAHELVVGELDGEPGADLAAVVCGDAARLAVIAGPVRDGVRLDEDAVGRLTGDAECPPRLILGAGDRDGDGRIDLALARDAARLYLTRGPLLRYGDLYAGADTVTDPAGGFDEPGPVVVGDLDGDGAADLIVGAPSADRVYGFLHPVTGDASTDEAELVFDGAALDHTGAALAIADFDRDGAVDLAVGAPGADGGAGEVGVWFGPVATGTDPDVRVVGGPANGFGAGLAALDLDGDGGAELAVFTRPDTVTVAANGGFTVTGPPNPWSLIRFGGGRPAAVWDLASDPVDTYPTYAGDQLGVGPVVVADFDRDGVPDLAAGAPAAGSVGAAYLWRGASLR